MNDIDYCPHTTYPIQVSLTLLDGDVDLTHDECGRIVQTDWPYLRADHVPLELVYATDGDEDWLELRARPVEQPQDAYPLNPARKTCSVCGHYFLAHRNDVGCTHCECKAGIAVEARTEQPQDERDGDVRVVNPLRDVDARVVDNAVGLLKSQRRPGEPVEIYNAICLLVAQFGSRIEAMDAALEARDAKAGAGE